jgi:aspartate/methionine/tyrosine aminotransferase
VLLLPGSTFGHPGNHVRVGLGREDFPVALARLEAFLDARSIG